MENLSYFESRWGFAVNLRRFPKMRALPRCAAEISICNINYNSPPSLTLTALHHLFPFNGLTVQERNPGILIQHRGWCNPIQIAPTPQATWRYHKQSPGGDPEALSVKKWKLERGCTKSSLSPKMSCPCTLFLPHSWIDLESQALRWWRDCQSREDRGTFCL